MKVIIVGLGKIGQKLAELLSSEEGHEVTVVDTVAEHLRYIVNEYDIMGVVGSGSNIDILEEAGIETADLLIAVTGSDEVNLLTCLLAKKAGNCKTIARVRKPEYSRELRLFKDDLGLAMVINPEQAAATEVARVLRFPSAIQIDTFAKGRVEILKFRIQEGSPLDDIRVADMAKRINCDILVCGVERGDKVFIPGGNFILKSGDLVSIVATPHNASDFFKKIGIKTNRVKDTLIIGGGGTAYYLAARLIQAGIKVKIIEQDMMRCEELSELLPKATIINGDGTDTDLLAEEGLEHYESVVALTGIDEENIMLTLFAKTQTKGKLVTKINRISYDNVIGGLGLDTIINPNNITAEYIARFVRAANNSLHDDIETMHMILDGKAEALEFRIKKDSPITDMTLEQIPLKDNVIIACINRNGKIIIPRGKDCILPGDTIIAVTTQLGIKDIKEFLR
ncbi:MAG: Trk system potassium transporter TrkA [Clostridia bacterium]|nr:Trk system potassium transporter TrkA [Clostridia bacterium]